MRTLKQLLQNGGREIHAWSADGPGEWFEAVFTWDDSLRKFVQTDPTEAEMYAAYEGAGTTPADRIRWQADRVATALARDEDVQSQLDTLEDMLAGDLTGIDSEALAQSRYIQARALAFLGHDDEAAAVYAALTADTLWGQLAALVVTL